MHTQVSGGRGDWQQLRTLSEGLCCGLSEGSSTCRRRLRSSATTSRRIAVTSLASLPGAAPASAALAPGGTARCCTGGCLMAAGAAAADLVGAGGTAGGAALLWVTLQQITKISSFDAESSGRHEVSGDQGASKSASCLVAGALVPLGCGAPQPAGAADAGVVLLDDGGAEPCDGFCCGSPGAPLICTWSVKALRQV